MKITFCIKSEQPAAVPLNELPVGVIGKEVGHPDHFYVRHGLYVTYFITSTGYVKEVMISELYDSIRVIPQPAGSYLRVEP